MKKITVACLFTTVTILLCGCSSAGNNQKIKSESSIYSNSAAASAESAGTNIKSTADASDLVVTTSKEGVRKTLLSGGWLSCDSEDGIKMHGGEKLEDEPAPNDLPPSKPENNIDNSPRTKDKLLNDSSLWFNNDGNVVFTVSNQKINCTYNINEDFSIDVVPAEENKFFPNDTVINFTLRNSNKYGIILYAEYGADKLRYFMTVI